MNLPVAVPAARTEPKGDTSEFTETEQEILVNAWLLARDGKRQVLEDWAEPEADQLCEAGWLERRTVEANGDMAFFWTTQAEAALDMNALRRADPRRPELMATEWTPEQLAALTCQAPGCMLLITLDSHLCAHHAYRRDMSRRRVRAARRAMTRKAKLFANPLCELEHPGCLGIANEVHHRVAMEDGGPEYAMDNLVSACKPCHSRETRREMLERGRAA